MTVKDLISELQKVDNQDLEVWISDDGMYYELDALQGKRFLDENKYAAWDDRTDETDKEIFLI